jgi:hypothetical protein
MHVVAEVRLASLLIGETSHGSLIASSSTSMENAPMCWKIVVGVFQDLSTGSRTERKVRGRKGGIEAELKQRKKTSSPKNTVTNVLFPRLAT